MFFSVLDIMWLGVVSCWAFIVGENKSNSVLCIAYIHVVAHITANNAVQLPAIHPIWKTAS